jgi:hypothetical protein
MTTQDIVVVHMQLYELTHASHEDPRILMSCRIGKCTEPQSKLFAKARVAHVTRSLLSLVSTIDARVSHEFVTFVIVNPLRDTMHHTKLDYYITVMLFTGHEIPKRS